MIFIVMAVESQLIPLKSKCHNLTYTPGYLPFTQRTNKDTVYENVFIPVHKNMYVVLQVGPCFPLISLPRPSNMKRAKINSWFTVQNLHSSDFFLFFLYLINSHTNRETFFKNKISNCILQFYLYSNCVFT